MSSARHAKGGITARLAASDTSLLGVIKALSRLLPKQLNDELALAKAELTRKGKAAAIAAAFFAVAAVFLLFLVIALVVAAVMGLATILPAWLSALLFAALFLVLMGIFALIGRSRLKKVMPPQPESAITGLRYDVGVLKSGRDFDPSTLQKTRLTPEEIKARKAQKKAAAQKAKAERDANAAQSGPALGEVELQDRTGARREHLLLLRGQLLAKADVKSRVRDVLHTAKGNAGHLSGTAADASGDVLGAARERWLPLGVLAVSTTAALVFLRRLLRS